MAQLTPEQFADGVSQALGGRLVSLLLYGSAASGTHVPDRSDVNTLLICDVVDEGLFAALEPALARWVRAGNPAPLILAEREWRESAPAGPEDLVHQAAAVIGFAPESLEDVVAHARGQRRLALAARDPRAAAYLAAVARTAEFVNRLS